MERIIPQVELPVGRSSAERFCDALRHWLNRVSFPPDSALATERQVAGHFGIGRGTVHKAYAALEQEGLLERRENSRIYRIRPAGQNSIPCIGILLPFPFEKYYEMDTSSGFLHLCYYNGIISECSRNGYATLPFVPPPPDTPEEKVTRYFESLLPRLSGIIHLGDRGFIEDPILERLLRCDEIPQMLLHGSTDCGEVSTISFDFNAMASILLDHLRELGHKRIGIAMPDYGPQKICRYDLTDYDSVAALFRKHGVAVPRESCLIFADSSALEEQFGRMLENPNHPTAFWCRNDESACMLIDAIRKAGCRVPEDFSVVGSGGARYGLCKNYGLCTLRTGREDTGKEAAAMLIRRIRQPSERVPVRVGISFTLIPGTSCGPAPVVPAQ